jgi:hypothetical protein
MARIESIQVRIVTSNLAIKIGDRISPPGTDGSVFLGLGGREFRLDTLEDDFETASDRVYILGLGANINNPVVNDPRSPQLDTQFLNQTPVYIRFAQRDGRDHWNLARARVTVNPGPQEVVFEANVGNLWFGPLVGAFCYLSSPGIIFVADEGQKS